MRSLKKWKMRSLLIYMTSESALRSPLIPPDRFGLQAPRGETAWNKILAASSLTIYHVLKLLVEADDARKIDSFKCVDRIYNAKSTCFEVLYFLCFSGIGLFGHSESVLGRFENTSQNHWNKSTGENGNQCFVGRKEGHNYTCLLVVVLWQCTTFRPS
jgi:hypothetical protein